MQGVFVRWTKGIEVRIDFDFFHLILSFAAFTEYKIHAHCQICLCYRDAALRCPPLALAIALDMRKGKSHDKSTFIEFPVIEIASAIGWNSGVVKYQLKQLEWTKGLCRPYIQLPIDPTSNKYN